MVVKISRGVYCILLCLLVTGAMPVWGQDDAEQYEYIDISNPFLRKIPLAVPYFKNMNGSAEERRLANSSADLLAASLAFTGYFKLLDRGAFLYDPNQDGVLTPQINFANWTVIGAELLITGLFEAKNGQIAVELRLFDTFKNKRIIGKKYGGRLADRRKIILRFCSEVIQYLTGHRGMFASKIAFVSTGTGHKEIYSCDFDGHNPVQLTRNRSISLFPAWSADGRYMAYTSYKDGRPDLFIKNLAEMQEVAVAQNGVNITPAWAPDKFELAATLSFSGDQEIYLLTGRGKIIKRLTRMRGSDLSPTWSPDGKKMAFVSNRSGNPQIYIKDLNSGKSKRLTFKGNYNTQPSWSPQGDKIVYSSLVDGRHNIFVIDTEGLEPLQLTYESGDNEAPSWSPDGSLIVYSSNREGPFRLYVMTAYGTDQRRLLLMKGEQTNPKWSLNEFDN